MREIEQTVSRHDMLEKGGVVLAAISGGPDSVALLDSLHALAPFHRMGLVAAHLNHGLRGEESDKDEQWVRDFCKNLEVPLETGRLGPPPETNIEAWARDERYRFLVEAAGRVGASRIAVGHHADDVAETVLINLLRGAGPAGLSGIAPVRPAKAGVDAPLIIRPLIHSSRESIMAYLERQGLEYREDSSNQDPKFLRNRVRAELIPLAESISPGAKDALVRAAEVTRIEAEALRAFAVSWLEINCTEGSRGLSLGLRLLREVQPGFRSAILREAIARARGDLVGVALTHLTSLDALVTTGAAHGSLDLPGLVARREYDTLVLLLPEDDTPPPKEVEQPREIILPVPGGVLWKGPGEKEISISAKVMARPSGDPDPASETWLDPSGIKGRLLVRSRKPGDRYRPVGLPGSRKLKDMMNELRVPPRARDLWPLVVSAGEIAWVPGFRPSKLAAAPPEADQVVRVSLSPPILPLDPLLGSLS